MAARFHLRSSGHARVKRVTAVIIGASLAGPCAAAALREERHSTALVEPIGEEPQLLRSPASSCSAAAPPRPERLEDRLDQSAADHSRGARHHAPLSESGPRRSDPRRKSRRASLDRSGSDARHRLLSPHGQETQSEVLYCHARRRPAGMVHDRRAHSQLRTGGRITTRSRDRPVRAPAAVVVKPPASSGSESDGLAPPDGACGGGHRRPSGAPYGPSSRRRDRHWSWRRSTAKQGVELGLEDGSGRLRGRWASGAGCAPHGAGSSPRDLVVAAGIGIVPNNASCWPGAGAAVDAGGVAS